MPSENDRYLNLAMILVGEAVAAIANLRQRDVHFGSEYGPAASKLLRAAEVLTAERPDAV